MGSRKNILRLWNKHWLLAVFGAVSLVLGFPAISYAEEEEIYFRADRQREITEEKITILQGNVEVHFREYIIWAKEIRIDDDKKEIYAVSDVKMEGEDRIMYGDALWYNYDTEQFLMINVKGVIVVADVSEPVYFTAKELRGTPRVFKMVDGTVTTCSPNEPKEVHIRAKMIKVMEDNKIIFRNGYFFIYDIPILYFPYWVFSLREVPYEIKAGKNDRDGVYVLVDWHYLYEENIYGTIIGNYFSRRGWEFGADHQWNIPSQGTGKAYFTYLRDRKAGPQTEIKASQNFQLSKNTKASLSIQQSSRDYYGTQQASSDRLNSRVSFNRNTPHASLTLNMSLNTLKSNTESTDFTTDMTYRHNWKTAKITFSTRISYSSKHTTGSAADQRLTTKYELSQSGGKKIDWKILFDFTADPDKDKKLNDTGNFLEKVPEITMTLKPELFGWNKHNPLGIQMKPVRLLGGHYFDLRTSGEMHGLAGSLDTEFSRNLKLSDSSDMRFSIGYNQSITSNGNAKYVYRPSINFTKKFSKKLNMAVTWNQAEDKGHNPFPTFDRSGSQNSMSWNLNLKQGKKWNHRWSTSYNLKTDTWSNLSWVIRWTPDQYWKANMTINYRIEQDEFGDLNPRFSYNNKRNFKSDTQLNYSLKESKLTQFRNSTDYIIGKEWIFHVDIQPNINEGFFNDFFRTVQITKYNPCTYFQLSYQTQREEFLLTWGVTAFPAAQVTLGEGIEQFGSFDRVSFE